MLLQLEYRQRDFVQKLKESDFSAAMDLLNTDRNRYTNILPLDKTRVILSDGIGTDYINANWVKDMQGKARYIASQAPLGMYHHHSYLMSREHCRRFLAHVCVVQGEEHRDVVRSS